MTEGDKKKIYYELRTHSVSKEKRLNYTDYTFGNYRVHVYWNRIIMSRLNPANRAFVIMRDTGWSDVFPKNDTYDIYIAAKNKYEGKQYVDPYKNIPIKKVIEDSVSRFDKIFTEHAADIFPYDMPEQQYIKTITEMENVLAQKIMQYKQKQKI